MSSASYPKLTLTHLSASELIPAPSFPPPKAHHGPTPNTFLNPWPSFSAPEHKLGLSDLWNGLVRGNPNAVPVPNDPKDRPVQVVKPRFGQLPEHGDKLKATWIGHASWLIEFPSTTQGQRGITLLLDPVFSERTSPVSFAGPKRYTPPPCTISELPHIDGIVISHSHYDHLDIHTIREIIAQQRTDPEGRKTFLLLPLGNKSWATDNLSDIESDEIIELDWWEGLNLERGADKVRIQCTPTQHFSGRTAFRKNDSLWSSWLFTYSSTTATSSGSITLYFAGDTGYRSVPESLCKPRDAASPYPGKEVLDKLPKNPSFAWIGEHVKVDLALLPVGLFNPVEWMSHIHCSPWDSVDIHKDLKARTSLAMHYGTVRGGISASYEPVDLPLTELQAACERESIGYRKAGSNEQLSGNGEFIYCNVGETVLVSA